MKVVIDSSAITEGDWHLSNNAAQALLAANNRGEIELLVPQVVFDEVTNSHSEKVRSKVSAMDHQRKELIRLLGSRASPDLREEVSSDPSGYVSDLWRRLTSAGVRFLEYPQVSHEDLARRALDRRPPFDKNGHGGYRDALVWHSVLEEASDGEMLVLVAKDGDFRAKDSDQLHPELIVDLRSARLNPERVQLAESLNEAVSEVLVPVQGVLTHLRARLTEDPEWSSELLETLRQVADAEADVIDHEVNLGVPLGLEGAETIEESFEYLDDAGPIAITDALPLESPIVGIELWMKSTASYEMEFSISHPEVGAALPAGLDYSADGRSVRTGGSADVFLVFEGRFDTTSSELRDLELIRVTDDIDRPNWQARSRWRPRTKGYPLGVPTQGLRRKRERATQWHQPHSSTEAG